MMGSKVGGPAPLAARGRGGARVDGMYH